MTRSQMLDILWSHVEKVLYISREDFDRAIAPWECRVLEIGGVPSFIVVTNGPEFHIDSLGVGTKMPLREISSMLDEIVTKHGYAFTRTPKEDLRQRRVNEMFGARLVDEDEFDVHYKLEKRSCQS